MTRKRGYLWLAAVLLVALLIVVYIGMRPQGTVPETAVCAAAADSLEEFSRLAEERHTPARYGGAKAEAAHGHSRYAGRDYPNETTAQAEPVSPPEHVYRKARRVTVELNSADSLDLVQLYNIGPAFAKRILKYRNLLGGFVSKDQLWEVYGMDSVRYNDIAPYVTINPEGVTPMDLNSATIDQLKRHPYLDYYQAKAIVRLREQVGLYQHIEDLRKVSIIDNETYTKLIPYLTCNSQLNK